MSCLAPARAILKAPFPYFGGKSRVAAEVWQRFGTVRNFIDPFCGSLAMLLGRPDPPDDGTETVNDADGFIANFWRATQSEPEAVAEYADWPANENDCAARHAWLVGQKETMQARLEGDPDWFDAKIAGWWVHGMASWIGSGYCSGEGPWHVVDGQLVHLGNTGRGVQRQLVHLGNTGRGVQRQRVHLGDTGQGVQRQRGGLLEYFAQLRDRLRRVRVCCGDWKRVCGGRSGNALRALFASGQPTAVFFDPPYPTEANREEGCYRVENMSVAHDALEWAIEHGDDPRFRIAFCGYEGSHNVPKSWQTFAWKAQGGYGTQAKGQSNGKVNCRRERIWFSPHCVKVGQRKAEDEAA